MVPGGQAGVEGWTSRVHIRVLHKFCPSYTTPQVYILPLKYPNMLLLLLLYRKLHSQCAVCIIFVFEKTSVGLESVGGELVSDMVDTQSPSLSLLLQSHQVMKSGY